MKRLVLAMCVGLALVATAAQAQWRNTSPGGDTGEYLHSNGVQGLRGLIDPSRMHMSQSVSMGYMSGSGVSASRGLYMNQIDYDISRKLSLTTHLGYQFQPSGPEEWNPAKNGNSFVGGADINWRPSSNSLFSLSVYRNMSPYGGYGRSNGYGWDPYNMYVDPWRR